MTIIEAAIPAEQIEANNRLPLDDGSADHNEGFHGENRPQSHDFLALTPITIITITMMAATRRAVPSEN